MSAQQRLLQGQKRQQYPGMLIFSFLQLLCSGSRMGRLERHARNRGGVSVLRGCTRVRGDSLTGHTRTLMSRPAVEISRPAAGQQPSSAQHGNEQNGNQDDDKLHDAPFFSDVAC